MSDVQNPALVAGAVLGTDRLIHVFIPREIPVKIRAASRFL
jgi:hypothetical protein